MPSVSQEKLRRLGRRAKRIWERRKDESAFVAAQGDTLLPAIDGFVTAYKAVEQYESTRKREVEEGRNAVAKLRTTVQGWTPRVVRDVPGFDGSTIGDSAVPDDVIDDTELLIETIEGQVDQDGKTLLAYAASALAELEAALVAAQKESAEAEAADSTYQKLLAEVRRTAALLDSELQLFRRAMATAFGRSDKDYQRLRVKRASISDPDDVEDDAGSAGATAEPPVTVTGSIPENPSVPPPEPGA